MGFPVWWRCAGAGHGIPHDEESKRPFKAITCWRWDALALCLAFCEALRTLPERRLGRAKLSPHSPLPPSSPATHLAMQPASRLRHLYLDCSAAGEDLFDTARRRLESAIGTLSVLDLLDETEDRRKHLPYHRLLAVVAQRRPIAVRGGIRTQTTITDGVPRRGRGLEESLCEPVCSLSRIHTGLNYERLCRTIRLVWLGCCGEWACLFATCLTISSRYRFLVEGHCSRSLPGSILGRCLIGCRSTIMKGLCSYARRYR